jgi:hypothetical protein
VVEGTLALPLWELTCRASASTVAPPAEVELEVVSGDEAIASYEWSVVEAPPTAAVTQATLPSTPQISLEVDLAGRYVLEVVAIDEQGARSEPCTMVVEGEPEEDLWIELSWSVPQDDLDLHVLAPGGTFQDGLLDCHWVNCIAATPDWGVLGEERDDPRLALDDIDGLGPENTRIRAPAEGVYTVVVHDYPGQYLDERNEAVVKVYVGGLLALEHPIVLVGEDEHPAVVEIALPEGIVTAL